MDSDQFHGPAEFIPLRISLRPITGADEEALFRIYASTREEEFAAVPWTAPQREAFLRQQFHAQADHYRAHYPGARLLMIEKEGRPIGRLYVSAGDLEIRVMDIALLPEHRRRGLGTALLKGILDEADAKGRPVTLHIERFNPVRTLYERLGFVPVEDRGVYLFMERPPVTPGRAGRA